MRNGQRYVSLKRFFKRNDKRIAVLTTCFYLFHIVAPVYYAKLQAELYMTVSGKVVDKETGKGLQKAIVGIFAIKDGHPIGMRGITATNQEGKYLLEMFPPGEYGLMVYPPKNSNLALDLTLTRKITIIRGRNVVNADFQLERGSSISGTVFDADGITGVANSPIIAISQNGSGIGQDSTDTNGKYEIKHLPPGNYVLIQKTKGYTLVVKENLLVAAFQNLQGVNIYLNPNKTTCISGNVKTTATGELIKDAVVAIFAEKKGGIEITNAEGKYRICGLDAGNYEMGVAAEGYGRLEGEIIEIRTNVEVVKDFNLAVTSQQGFWKYKKENKRNTFGLNIKKAPLQNFGASYVYAQDGGGGWCPPETSCYDACLDAVGVKSVQDAIKKVVLDCFLPSDTLTGLLFAMCGFTPSAAPWFSWLLKRFVAAAAFPAIDVACAIVFFYELAVCPFVDAILCALECP